MDITNEQWNRIEPIITASKPPRDPRGRRARDPRKVLNGDTMDPSNGGTLEGSTTTVSAIPDMPSSVPAMDQTGCFPTNYPVIGGRPARKRKN